MVSVNASRKGTVSKMDRAFQGAKLVGQNRDGELCMWYGGYSFNVYDAARDWDECRTFSSGALAGDVSGDEAREIAKERMLMEDFTPIE